jgi:hypothetical protein
MTSGIISSIASQATDNVADNLLMVQPRLELSAEEEKSFTESMQRIISGIIRSHAVANLLTIRGRLSSSRSYSVHPATS